MKDLVARRYVETLIDGRDSESINTISNKLNQVASAFADKRFSSIISSPEISNKSKVDSVISFVDGTDNPLNNFIKLLGEKRRLDLLPFIARDSNIQLAKMNNSYIGAIYTNQELSSDYISSIEKQSSKKFDVKSSLSQNVCDYDGIKVDIDGLGVEISFFKDRLKSQLIDHILKAV